MDKPVLDLKTPYTTPPSPINDAFVDRSSPVAGVGTSIDINTTVITDGEKTSTLATFFKGISDNGTLMLDAVTVVSDGVNVDYFDIKRDTDTGLFGIGTAFLQD